MVPRLAIVVVIVLAGCSGAGGPESPHPGATTDTPVQTTRSAATPVIPDDATEANTVEYAELTEEQENAFDAAVTGGAEFLPSEIDSGYFDPDLSDPFERNDYVLKNETYFELSYRSGAQYSSHEIRAVEARPSENDTVVAFDDLSNRSQQVVRSAIESGSYTSPWRRSNSIPPDLSGVNYVRYSGTHYRLSVTVGDVWVQIWTAERVE